MIKVLTMNHRPNIMLQALAAGFVAIIMMVTGVAVAQTPSGDVTIAGFDLLSKKRVGRTTFEYEYGVNVQNGTSSDVSDVSATVSSSSTNVTVVDGNAVIGDIASGTTATSGDTVKVAVDRRGRFSPDQLDAEFNYFVEVRDDSNRIAIAVPTHWIIDKSDNYIGFYFDDEREESALPPNFLLRTFDTPPNFRMLARDEALLESLKLSGITNEDIRSLDYDSIGLVADTKSFGRYHYVLYNENKLEAVVFATGDSSLFESAEFKRVVDNLSF